MRLLLVYVMTQAIVLFFAGSLYKPAEHYGDSNAASRAIDDKPSDNNEPEDWDQPDHLSLEESHPLLTSTPRQSRRKQKSSSLPIV